MPITVIGDREGNTLDVPLELMRNAKGAIRFVGTGGHFAIGVGCNINRGLKATIGPGSRVTIGSHCTMHRLTLFTRLSASIQVGDHVGMSDDVRLLAHESAGITIGNRCLIAGGTQMLSSDMHSIVDVQSGQRINPSRPIVLADHVWIAANALVLKGACIGADTVIAAGAVVSGEIPSNSVAAGSPARVVRSGVTWAFSLLPEGPTP